MAKLPDGWVFIPKAKRNVIEIEEKELVICRNCKYGEPWGVLIGCGTAKGFGITHKPDWFCADGERRDGDD